MTIDNWDDWNQAYLQEIRCRRDQDPRFDPFDWFQDLDRTEEQDIEVWNILNAICDKDAAWSDRLVAQMTAESYYKSGLNAELVAAMNRLISKAQ